MEYKDPMHELLSSLEQIVFKDETQKITLTHRTTSCTEIEQLRKGTGLKIDDFARVLGVSVAMVKEWESRRVKPSSAELKLMRLIQANPALSKQLMESTFIHFIAVYGPDDRTVFQPINHKYEK